MESLKRNWGLLLALAAITFGALFYYRASAPIDPYVYETIRGSTYRTNKATGIQDVASESGWRR